MRFQSLLRRVVPAALLMLAGSLTPLPAPAQQNTCYVIIKSTASWPGAFYTCVSVYAPGGFLQVIPVSCIPADPSMSTDDIAAAICADITARGGPVTCTVNGNVVCLTGVGSNVLAYCSVHQTAGVNASVRRSLPGNPPPPPPPPFGPKPPRLRLGGAPLAAGAMFFFRGVAGGVLGPRVVTPIPAGTAMGQAALSVTAALNAAGYCAVFGGIQVLPSPMGTAAVVDVLSAPGGAIVDEVDEVAYIEPSSASTVASGVELGTVMHVGTDLYSGVTAATTRGAVSTGTGEILQAFPSTHFIGIGDDGKSCLARGLQAVIQDQVPATPETFDLIVRNGAGAPDPFPSGQIIAAAGLSLPFSSSTTPRAYTISVMFATPPALPCAADTYVGVRFPAEPTWPSDGPSVHLSSVLTVAGLVTDAASPAAPNLAWQVVTTTGAPVVSQPTNRTFRLGQLVGQVSFRTGNLHSVVGPPSPAFGLGGLFPFVAGGDGLAFRVTMEPRGGGVAAVLAAAGTTGGLSFMPVRGRVFLDPGTIIQIASFAVDQLGTGAQSTFPLGSLGSLAGAGVIPFQAAVLDSMGSVFTSNVQGVTF